MAESAFSLTYDGPALADGSMPVRELAPALLGVGDLVAEAARLLYPDKPPVGVSIRATREGSFLVHLAIEADKAWDLLVELFDSSSAAALAHMKEAIFGELGVIWLIKAIKRRKVKRVEASPEPGKTKLVLEDDAVLEVPLQSLTLFESIEVRKGARLVVSPLSHEGIEEVRFKTDGALVVTEDEVPSFELPTDSDVLVDEERQMAVQVVTLSFEGNKWRLSLGEGQPTIRATIEDQNFWHRVASGLEAFRAGDVLVCRMRVIQTQRPTGLVSEYHLLEVVEHRPSGVQLSIEDA